MLIEQLNSITFSIPVSYLIARIGLKHSIILSYIFLVPSILFIRVEGLTSALIVISAII
jgi:hypothetical protein